MEINILQGSTTGTTVYTETQTPTTNGFGLVNIEIGTGAGFSTIGWTSNAYFIKIKIDPTGGTNYSITGITQLLSVPYALQSKTTESFASMTQSQIDALTPGAGLIVYNNSTKNLVYYNGAAFRNIVTQPISSGALSIGQNYQGGTIFYIDATGQHGLIAAPTDIPAISWCVGTAYISTGATATAIGNGNANTNAIISRQGAGSYAAQACADLVSGGYSDWYLPSSAELQLMYTNIAIYTGMNVATRYWTSSETTGDPTFGNALAVRWSDGVVTLVNKKNTLYSVRAVRSF
ncbi:MAG: hypothetical protein PHO27_10355 [Sulfuricurvum sp.]|nr:hypothetical protein [Sulfuricurvum sp.]